MNFKQRFAYFGFGTALGCLMVYFMLIKDRDFPAWLPEDRVLEELTMNPITIIDGIELPYADSLLPAAIMKSDVLFDESDVRSEPCRTYQLDSDEERMRLKICDKEVSLIEYKQK